MLSGFIIICLAATSYTSAFTNIIKHIISSFNVYANEAKDVILVKCKKFLTYNSINLKTHAVSCF